MKSIAKSLEKLYQSSFLKLLFLTLLIVCIYYPGKNGPFLADDYPNIIDNPGIQIHHLTAEELSSAWSANRSGPLSRPIASLSFALNYYFAGQQIDPVHFKLTNVAIHILNSFLVFFISQLLFSIFPKQYPAQKLAFICALIWALHPLQLTAVLYVVQRMTSLSCFFMLSGFLIYLKARIQIEKPSRVALMYAGCLFGTLLGGLAKENALLLPFLMFATEITLLRAVPVGTARNKLYSFYALTAIIPAILAFGYLVTHQEFFLGGYVNRDFTFAERLMTQARVLLYYLGLLVYPDNTQLSWSHDDFALSRALFDPVNTLPAILGVVLLLSVAIVNSARNKAPFLNFAIAWFFIAQSMESSIIALEMVYEHRNYVPSIGIIIGLVALIHPLTAKLEKKALINVLYATLIISLGLATYTRAAIWSERDSFVHFEVRNHPLSVRSQSFYAKNVELNHGPDTDVYEHYRIAAQLDEHEISALIEMFIVLGRIKLNADTQNAADNLPSQYDSPSLFKADYLQSLSSSLNQVAVPLPNRYDDRLALKADYLQSLSLLLDKEIVRRLTYKSNGLRTAISLRIAATCLLKAKPECIAIAPNILGWTDAVLTQPGFPEMSLIYTIREKIYFYQGDLERALNAINMAIKLAPNQYYYYAEKAALHTQLNQWDQAEAILDDAATRLHLSGFDIRELNNLRQLVKQKIPASSFNITQ